jgi:hypothetical protein
MPPTAYGGHQDLKARAAVRLLRIPAGNRAIASVEDQSVEVKPQLPLFRRDKLPIPAGDVISSQPLCD